MVHNLDVEPKRKYNRSLSGYRGVHKNPGSGRFRATITLQRKRTALGTFDTALQAALAYDQAAIKEGYKKSTLNFPVNEKDEKTEKKEKKEKMKDLLAIQEYNEMLQIWQDME